MVRMHLFYKIVKIHNKISKDSSEKDAWMPTSLILALAEEKRKEGNKPVAIFENPIA